MLVRSMAPKEPGRKKAISRDAALRAGLTIRNYGFLCDLTQYAAEPPFNIPHERYPACKNLVVSYPTKMALIKNNDPFFRGYDNAFPDYYRENEWEREFDRFSKNGNLPALEFVRLMHDHMGNFGDAIDRVDTPNCRRRTTTMLLVG